MKPRSSAGLEIVAVSSLGEAVRALNDPAGFRATLAPSCPSRLSCLSRPSGGSRPLPPDLADVRGQLLARRALEVAAAGGHNLLLVGPPGAGKTMMARRVSGILPPLSFEEALEVTAIHSVAGLLPTGGGLLTERPFRSPHHTISNAALIGGGSQPRPGEVSLAHHGVLFLDEMLEFSRHVLEVLRQPLEEGRVAVARAARTAVFPARFMLVGAMNPCPCGFAGDPSRECRCPPQVMTRYRDRLSGPLRDRLDLTVEVPALPLDALSADAGGESSADVRARVVSARGRQAARYADDAHLHQFGADLGADGEALCRRPPGATRAAIGDDSPVTQRARLRSRAQGRLGRLPILPATSSVGADHIAEALQFRMVQMTATHPE